MNAGVVLHGGTSIRTDPELLLAYAHRLDALAGLTEQQLLVRLAAVNLSPALLAAAALDPAGAAQVLELTATCIVLATALLAGCRALATSLRLAAAGYTEADRLERRAVPLVRSVRRLPAALDALRQRHYQQVITADPQLADAAMDWLTLLGTSTLGGSLLDTSTFAPSLLGRLDPAGYPASGGATAGTAGTLALIYRDGRPVVIGQPGLPTLDARGAPRSTADLFADVALRERYDRDGGAIDIRLLDGPAGRRVIVDITGTTDWNANPVKVGSQATDLGTNLRSLAGQSSVMSRGVTLALHRAGVTPDEQIMLVGHSQGGMVAARLATELNGTGEFRVSQLVTAGSPIGSAAVPRSVSVLSLENHGDPVPELDGSVNPRRPSWLTAEVSRGGDGITGRHSITAYQAAAADLDADSDPALARWRSGARGFLQASTVHTLVYRVSRD